MCLYGFDVYDWFLVCIICDFVGEFSNIRVGLYVIELVMFFGVVLLLDC